MKIASKYFAFIRNDLILIEYKYIIIEGVNSSNLVKKSLVILRTFFMPFISYMKLRYENAKMYSLWPGNGFCDQN